MQFWDYGNAFLVSAGRAGGDVFKSGSEGAFKYPSYVEDIMGDIFSLGFGPYRWVCTSGDPEDLQITDDIAAGVIERQLAKAEVSEEPFAKAATGCYRDNLNWIRQAGENKMVVGSQARILYSDAHGRKEIARQMNLAVRDGRLKGLTKFNILHS